MCVAAGATDSDRRELSVSYRIGTEAHKWSCVTHDSAASLCVAPAMCVAPCPVGRPIDLGSLISTMGGPMGIGLPMVN